MIFATVGTQLAFPRLIEALDSLANDTSEEIIAQIGPDPGQYKHIETRASLTPEEFERCYAEARVVVGHAGVGTILSAKKFNKSLVLLPRKHSLGEHRNDHQLATAKAVEKLTGIYIAWDTAELQTLLFRDDLAVANNDESPTHSALIDRLKVFIEGK